LAAAVTGAADSVAVAAVVVDVLAGSEAEALAAVAPGAAGRVSKFSKGIRRGGPEEKRTV